MANSLTSDMTHPWISFRLDLSKASPNMWLMLGEAQSKCLHLASVPLKPATSEYLHEVLLARGALATTAIEGNTLSENEALKIVKRTSKLPKSQEYLANEIENIIKATSLILDEIVKAGDHAITSEEIRNYNKLVLASLNVDEHVTPGKYRECGIEVSSYIGPKWEEVPKLVDNLCDWLNGEAFKIIEDGLIINSIIKAIVAHIYIAWIHPFGDGNGRTSRLVEYRIMAEGGVPSPAAHLLSNHYNKTRTEYYRRLEEISKNGGNILPFLEYAIEGFVDQLKDHLIFIKAHQWQATWQNYIYEKFGPKRNASTERQLQLVLAMSKSLGWFSKSEILKLTPELAAKYARKTEKTLSRDLNKLNKMKLIEFVDGKVSARFQMVLSFLPKVRKGEINRQIEEMQEVLDEAMRNVSAKNKDKK